MRVLRQFGVVALLVVLQLTSAMACVAGDGPGRAEAMACCRRMQGGCGQMAMPSPDGCCGKAQPSERASARMTAVVRWQPVFTRVSRLADGLASGTGAAMWASRVEDSPPKSPPGSIFILRI